jgi:hypothetical protein
MKATMLLRKLSRQLSTFCYIYGEWQLAALGVLGEEEGGVDSDSSIVFQLMEMYEGMGHTIALQVRPVSCCVKSPRSVV